MVIETTLPDQKALKEAFDHEIYSSSGTPFRFGSLFHSCDTYPAEKRILVVFIRHFFCGNCQEYVRRLSSKESPFHPSHRTRSGSTASSTSITTNFSKPATRSLPTVIVIGPGLPTLIPTYAELTQCPYPIYADPSTRLYNLLGMHRTLALGPKAPVYIQHSLLSGAVKSAWQIVRRVGNGDAMGGGGWDVNGGEFLFVQPQPGQGHCSTGAKSGSPSRSATGRAPSSTRASVSGCPGWEISWCHRMHNSRDHTEIVDLQYHTCLSRESLSARAPSPSRSILVNGKTYSKSSSRSQMVQPSYSNECVGSCPGPDIPKSREEAFQNQALRRSYSKHKSPRRDRSRSGSANSRSEVPHKGAEPSTFCSESRASISMTHSVVPTSPAINEEDEPKPRKSFTATVVERVSVLTRSKSVSERENAVQSVPRTTDEERASAAGPSISEKRGLKPSGTDHSITALLRTKSQRRKGSQSSQRTQSHSETPSCAPSDSTSPVSTKKPQKHARTRTSSSSKASGSKKGVVEMDENGVMLVDGVEFVNVISVKARVDATMSKADGSRVGRVERVDGGLGHNIERSFPVPVAA